MQHEVNSEKSLHFLDFSRKTVFIYSMQKSIGHIKFPSLHFFIEDRENPKFRFHPKVLVGAYQQRAPILEVSDEASKIGIVKGQMLGRALRQCRDLRIVIANIPRDYQIFLRLQNYIRNFSPLVEPDSFSSLFVDFSGNEKYFTKKNADILNKIEKEIHGYFGFFSNSGLAQNKFVSEVAAQHAISEQQDIIEVEEGNEKLFLSPSSVHVLPVSSPKITRRLIDLNYTQLGFIQDTKPNYLHALFGTEGQKIHQLSNGIDNRPMISESSKQTISHQTSFSQPTNDRDLIRSEFTLSVHQIARSLRSNSTLTKKIIIEVIFIDYQIVYRQASFPLGINLERLMIPKLEELLFSILSRRLQVIQITLTASGLMKDANQVVLWNPVVVEKEFKLMNALDRIESKFGRKSVRFSQAGLGSDSDICNPVM